MYDNCNLVSETTVEVLLMNIAFWYQKLPTSYNPHCRHLNPDSPFVSELTVLNLCKPVERS